MRAYLAVGAAAALIGSGCVGSDSATVKQSRGPFHLPCDDSVDDVYASSTTDPTSTLGTQSRGVIAAGNACQGAGECSKCAAEGDFKAKTDLDLAQLAVVLRADGYQGPMPTETLKSYRIAYRTERLAGGLIKQGTSTARLLVPLKQIASTLVVVAHDTTGFAPQCAPSLVDLKTGVNDDQALALALAGHGYLTIAPDLAGSATGDAPPGWQLAEDEAHGLLDATRAVKDLEPKFAAANVVLVGLGEGGHAVLSAQAIASSYGLEGKLVGVAAFAPIWIAPRTWGAALESATEGLNGQDNAAELAFDLLYFFGHGELYDGNGGGVTMLRDEQRSAARNLIETRCFGDLTASIHKLGKVATDIFDPTFVHEVSSCAQAGHGESCQQGTAKTWNTRFTADRPKVDPTGAPIVVWQGGADTLVPPAQAICGRDAIERALGSHPSTLTYCGDDKATHGGVVEKDLGWVISWIDHLSGQGSAPKACAAFAPTDDDGKAVACGGIPPNGD